MKTVNRPEPNSTPELAMELLLEKARLIFNDQNWSAWTWEAREYGTREPKRIKFAYRDGAFLRL